MDAHGQTDAAVLVPLYLDAGDLHAVFTKRRDDLRRHAGEISFPGGRQDHPDEDLRRTALREADEEIGLPPDAVELVGALPPTATFVDELPHPPLRGGDPARARLDPQPTEVEEVLELSLPDLIKGFEMKRLIEEACPSEPRATP